MSADRADPGLLPSAAAASGRPGATAAACVCADSAREFTRLEILDWA